MVQNIFENGSQNHLIFESVFSYFKIHANDDIVMARKSKSLSDVSVKRKENNLDSRLDYFYNPKLPTEFDGSCLKLDKLTFAPN